MLKSIFNSSVRENDTSGNKTDVLHKACQDGNLAVIRELLGEDPNLIRKATEKDGYTVLHSACQGGDLEVVKELLRIDPNLINKGERP